MKPGEPTHEVNPKDLKDVAQVLRFIADRIEAAKTDDLPRYCVVCAASGPCPNEEKEGHSHNAVSMAIGGNMDLAMEVHHELTGALLQLDAPRFLQHMMKMSGGALKVMHLKNAANSDGPKEDPSQVN